MTRKLGPGPGGGDGARRGGWQPTSTVSWAATRLRPGLLDRTSAQALAGVRGACTGLHREGLRRRATGESAGAGRWLAAVLACGEEAVLSHGSAAALWGMAARPTRTVVERNRSRGPPVSPGTERHPAPPLQASRPSEGTIRDDIPVTTVARTLFDFAEVVDFQRLRAGLGKTGSRLQPPPSGRRWRENSSTDTAVTPYGRSAGFSARSPPPRHHPLIAGGPLRRLLPGRTRPARAATNVVVLGHEVDALWPAAAPDRRARQPRIPRPRRGVRARQRLRDARHLVSRLPHRPRHPPPPRQRTQKPRQRAPPSPGARPEPDPRTWITGSY